MCVWKNNEPSAWYCECVCVCVCLPACLPASASFPFDLNNNRESWKPAFPSGHQNQNWFIIYSGINSASRSMEGNSYPKIILLLYRSILSPLPQQTETKETSVHQTKRSLFKWKAIIKTVPYLNRGCINLCYTKMFGL